ncbi:hypothetical protein SAMN04487912_105283 [Arthrobacter sp. cf158]|uniref:hypothetical protein n=1 Tax=Arthrobacter sp. cf158 TaxID=1761744 RepID=UPI0008961BEF|nr:hypothetical protein [Arthrobacter sp. cf158]SDW89772.1 hypothetical protein SAMN04487912_105283 [Arthrobacter sp. cf158]
MKRFDDSWKYAKTNFHDKWDRDNKLYDNERYKKAYKGTTDTFVPMPFSIVETLTTAVFNANLRFQLKSGTPIGFETIETGLPAA